MIQHRLAAIASIGVNSRGTRAQWPASDAVESRNGSRGLSRDFTIAGTFPPLAVHRRFVRRRHPISLAAGG
jgi:hypothetical protein